ncbi:unnamed protein product [Eruca vesicaria subsp. sativa]|uniref:Uncharacterized protein n=1 Tax=Eruca vesicaria subsp. sativa TaxID=29727 RepID=A0ABC8LWU9_ERUVS|nr:unnamed protein product [Eruca vesicaria subsp. sativa]
MECRREANRRYNFGFVPGFDPSTKFIRDVRFLRFWEARNVCCSGELRRVDLIFINSQVVKKDEDVKAIVVCDDDWLPLSPKVVFDKSKESSEESTTKALSYVFVCMCFLCTSTVRASYLWCEQIAAECVYEGDNVVVGEITSVENGVSVALKLDRK